MNSERLNHQKEFPAFGQVNRFPIFPLPIFLLSGGMQRLRIFEQKYISMIANANDTNGFIISLFQKHKPYMTSLWGTHVQIVDFDQGEDGLLNVDVLAGKMVTISNIEQQHDGLIVASAKELQHWSSSTTSFVPDRQVQPREYESYMQLSFILKKLFNSHHELSNLYKQQYFDYPEWVCARLLEIVPLPLNEKEKFVQKLDFSQLIALLGSMCEEEASN